jgi:hypothetical protein
MTQATALHEAVAQRPAILVVDDGQAHRRWPGLDIVQGGNTDANMRQACLLRDAHAVPIQGQPLAELIHPLLQSPLREVASC